MKFTNILTISQTTVFPLYLRNIPNNKDVFVYTIIFNYTINPQRAEIFLYKPKRTKFFIKK